MNWSVLRSVQGDELVPAEDLTQGDEVQGNELVSAEISSG